MSQASMVECTLPAPSSPLPSKAAAATSAQSPVTNHIRLVDLLLSAAVVVFDGLNMEVRERECVVVLGPSGTGKSVLLKHIVGRCGRIPAGSSDDQRGSINWMLLPA